MNTNILRIFAVVFATVFFVSCDKDYNTLGSDVLGGENIDIEGTTYGVKVYNKDMGPVQTNNLPINQLGVLNNPVFGTTTANFVTQLELATLAPTFKTHIVVDSVVLSVPYFSTKLRTDSDGRGVYRLDSIYSNTPNTKDENRTFDPIKLKVYRNGYNLLDVDASDPSQTAKYYSNQDTDFNSSKTDLLYTNDVFMPKQNEYKKYKRQTTFPFGFTTEVESRSVPRLRLLLDNTYFTNTIISASADKLVNNNAFKDYFKGLYFNVENGTGEGTLMSLDFTKGDVTIFYHQDKVNSTVVGGEQEMGSLTLNMKGNTVNLLNNNIGNADYTNYTSYVPLTNGLGQDKLFLKGGHGSQAFIELFKDNELNDLRKMNPLINDATLTFTVDDSYLNPRATFTGGVYSYHPKRIYLFDADNDRILFDYAFDSSTNSDNSKLNKYIYGGILNKDTAGKRTYKFRIVEHISRVIGDEEGTTYKNVRLGLVITENINLSTYGSLKNSFTFPYTNSSLFKDVKTYPAGAIMNPLGTVLYGNTNDAATEVTFKINYTKPN